MSATRRTVEAVWRIESARIVALGRDLEATSDEAWDPEAIGDDVLQLVFIAWHRCCRARRALR